MSRVPVDRGWSWMVLIGAFLSSFFVIGGFKSTGIIFVHVLERYDAGEGLTAWMMGLMSFGLALFSPISTSMGMRFTYRASVMLGGAVMSLGYLIAAYSPNIYCVVIVLGSFVGFGNGFLYTPSMIMVGQYFNRHRSLAMGLAASGGSFGSLVIPLLVRFLLDHYDYQGCMLIYSAFVMNAIVGGALLRPQEFYKSRVEKTGAVEDVDALVHTPSQSINSLVFTARIQESLTSTPMNILDKSERAHTFDNIEDTVLECGPDERGDSGEFPALEFPVRVTAHYRSNGSICMEKEEIRVKPDKLYYHSSGSIQMLSDEPYKDQGDDDVVGQNIEDLEHVPQPNCFRQCLNGIISPFKNMFDPEVFKTCVFWVYFIGVCLANAGYIDQFLFIPPYAKEIGISNMRTAGILSASGVADLIGRISGGLLNNLRLIPIHVFISITLFTSAIAILICLIFPCYATLLAHGVVLGLIGGMYIALFPVILLELLGGTKFPRAFAFTMMGVGFTNLPLPPLFGFISDSQGSYTVPYIILNVMMLAGGLLFCIIPCAQEVDKRRENAKTVGKSPEEGLDAVSDKSEGEAQQENEGNKQEKDRIKQEEENEGDMQEKEREGTKQEKEKEGNINEEQTAGNKQEEKEVLIDSMEGKC